MMFGNPQINAKKRGGRKLNLVQTVQFRVRCNEPYFVKTSHQIAPQTGTNRTTNNGMGQKREKGVLPASMAILRAWKAREDRRKMHSQGTLKQERARREISSSEMCGGGATSHLFMQCFVHGRGNKIVEDV